jgi:ATP-binding protein involved in chromosome partitioning
MSTFCCPNCGHRIDIFSHGGAEATAQALRVPFLGSIPLTPTIRQSGDEGVPLPIYKPDSPEAQAFEQIAKKLAAQISIRNQRTIPLVVQ